MKKILILLISAIITAASTSLAIGEEVVNVYSHREKVLIQPVLDLFTVKTGIKVNLTVLKGALPEKLTEEGKNSPADVLITTDLSRLVRLSEDGDESDQLICYISILL